jgi:hypothetical protein
MPWRMRFLPACLSLRRGLAPIGPLISQRRWPLRCGCLLQIMFVLFVVATVLWSVIVVKAKPNAHRIHQLMIVLVTFKSLTLLSQVRAGAAAVTSAMLWHCVRSGCAPSSARRWLASPPPSATTLRSGSTMPTSRLFAASEHGCRAQAGMYHLIRATGHAEGWSIAFYFFTFIRGVLFFTVIVLIGTGWSYLKVRISLCGPVLLPPAIVRHDVQANAPRPRRVGLQTWSRSQRVLCK